MLIDMTAELSPILYAMNALLVVSAVALAAEPMARALRKWLRTLPRLRITVERPALGQTR